MPTALPGTSPGLQNLLVQVPMAWLWLIYRPGTWPLRQELCDILSPCPSVVDLGPSSPWSCSQDTPPPSKPNPVAGSQAHQGQSLISTQPSQPSCQSSHPSPGSLPTPAQRPSQCQQEPGGDTPHRRPRWASACPEERPGVKGTEVTERQ